MFYTSFCETFSIIPSNDLETNLKMLKYSVYRNIYLNIRNINGEKK